MTLVEFLRARLDEDEARARGKSPQIIIYDAKRRPVPPTPAWTGGYSARRVLAEVDAKRRIIARWEQAREEARNPVSSDHLTRTSIARGELEDVLRDLALPYAGHPDYDEAWRP